MNKSLYSIFNIAVISIVLMIGVGAVFALFAFNQMAMVSNIAIQGELLNTVNEKLGQGETGNVLQQTIESGMAFNTDVLKFLVVNKDGQIIAGVPQNLIGTKSSEIESNDLGVNANKILIQSHNSDYMILSYWQKDADYAANMHRLLNNRYWSGRLFDACFIIFELLLVFWVYRDGKERNLNAYAWGILIFLTSILGWTVYIITRPKQKIDELKDLS
ncbi:MAG: hypothetical protein ABFD08_00235 [Syntrophomonas sp.]